MGSGAWGVGFEARGCSVRVQAPEVKLCGFRFGG